MSGRRPDGVPGLPGLRERSRPHARFRATYTTSGATFGQPPRDAEERKEEPNLIGCGAPCGGSGSLCLVRTHGLTPEARGVAPLSGLRARSGRHAPYGATQTRSRPTFPESPQEMWLQMSGDHASRAIAGPYRRHLAGCLGGILPPIEVLRAQASSCGHRLLRAGRPQDSRRDGGVTSRKPPHWDANDALKCSRTPRRGRHRMSHTWCKFPLHTVFPRRAGTGLNPAFIAGGRGRSGARRSERVDWSDWQVRRASRAIEWCCRCR